MPSFSNIEEEIQTILDSFADIEIGEAHAEETLLSMEQKVALNSYLEELGTQEKDKVDGLGMYLRSESNRAEFLRSEAARLINKARAIENKTDHIKDYYLSVMQRNGLKKIAGNTFTVSARATKVCAVKDMDAVPQQFLKTETKVSPMKAEILKALKAGQVVPGCEISENVSLQVR